MNPVSWREYPVAASRNRALSGKVKNFVYIAMTGVRPQDAAGIAGLPGHGTLRHFPDLKGGIRALE